MHNKKHAITCETDEVIIGVSHTTMQQREKIKSSQAWQLHSRLYWYK